jgi:hypothetical protein
MNPNNVNQFPPAWAWLIDEAIPTWVKKHYSPRESWKEKPFSKEDAHFFFKGIEELSDLFTEERPKGMPPYFQHPKYRSAYLLYFFPLQAAKFLTLYQMYPKAIEAAFESGRKTGVIRIADLGSGPGTASLSLLLVLLNQKLKLGESLPRVELHWFDTNESIMEDGRVLAEQLAASFPKLRGKVEVKTYTTPWWRAARHLPENLSLVLIGHLLNESMAPQSELDSFWQSLAQKAQGGGILLVEPAARKPAQILASLRNSLFDSEVIERTPTRIWGPCLHAEACPLTDGRDWCHFSIPIQIPGKWFKGFSEGLGSERHWVKFTYVWIASEEYPAPQPHPRLRRVISDPLNQGLKPAVLLCEPETPRKWPIHPKDEIWRGDLITLKKED